MDLSYFMMLWNFLLAVYIAYADVIREDGYHNYEGQFTVKNKGRMLRVLMSFRNVKPEECALHCVRHLRCRTFNYRPGKKDCELTDEEFHKMDVDIISHGWYNYGTPKRVNGGWSSWMYFTECTKTCGNGTRDQYRDCDSPTPEHGGADCYGKMIRRVKCNIRECPVNGGWSGWRNGTDCTKPCGSGTLDQYRECDSPKPAYGGADCKGVKNRIVSCNTHECPVDGEWSSWRNSTGCTESCGGGTLEQTRECDSPRPQHGGAGCTGDNRRTVECNTNGCPAHGGWSKWKDSTDCTKSCGSGILKQRRDCDSPKPEYGGDDCTGIEERTVKCNTFGCPPAHGGWSKWKDSTDCTKSCGSGILEQRRDCDFPKPEYGGANCTGKDTQTVRCNTHECPAVNVALGKIARHSSTMYDDDAYSASHAVDGYTYTGAWTKKEDNPWWKVDLGEVKAIKEIRMITYVYDDTFNMGLLVKTRTNEGSWTICKNIGDLKNRITEFQCDHKITNARFVRIVAMKKCELYLKEVEIFGD